LFLDRGEREETAGTATQPQIGRKGMEIIPARVE
jgi:hypothetical protein